MNEWAKKPTTPSSNVDANRNGHVGLDGHSSELMTKSFIMCSKRANARAVFVYALCFLNVTNRPYDGFIIRASKSLLFTSK